MEWCPLKSLAFHLVGRSKSSINSRLVGLRWILSVSRLKCPQMLWLPFLPHRDSTLALLRQVTVLSTMVIPHQPGMTKNRQQKRNLSWRPSLLHNSRVSVHHPALEVVTAQREFCPAEFRYSPSAVFWERSVFSSEGQRSSGTAPDSCPCEGACQKQRPHPAPSAFLVSCITLPRPAAMGRLLGRVALSGTAGPGIG